MLAKAEAADAAAPQLAGAEAEGAVVAGTWEAAGEATR